MRFWGTSALVPLLIAEPATGEMKELLAEDPEVAIWWGTAVECASAMARRRREGTLDERRRRQARERLRILSRHADEILPSGPLRRHAKRAVDLHPLRAADALQLAAALIWSDGRPETTTFITLDARLREAAQREGFEVLPASLPPL